MIAARCCQRELTRGCRGRGASVPQLRASLNAARDAAPCACKRRGLPAPLAAQASLALALISGRASKREGAVLARARMLAPSILPACPPGLGGIARRQTDGSQSIKRSGCVLAAHATHWLSMRRNSAGMLNDSSRHWLGPRPAVPHVSDPAAPPPEAREGRCRARLDRFQLPQGSTRKEGVTEVAGVRASRGETFWPLGSLAGAPPVWILASANWQLSILT
eukprot:352020-Chlamydomonas_euryale.AAC.3